MRYIWGPPKGYIPGTSWELMQCRYGIWLSCVIIIWYLQITCWGGKTAKDKGYYLEGFHGEPGRFQEKGKFIALKALMSLDSFVLFLEMSDSTL